MFLRSFTALAMASGIFCASAHAAGELTVLNWSDYIAPDTIERFEKRYDIKVTYAVMDSNEMLEARLMAGHSGYDVIVPSLHVLKRLAVAGLLMELNKTRLPNFKHLDTAKLAKISRADPDNRFGIPYLELSTGLALNLKKVKEVLGPDAPLDSWDLLFKPEYVSKLSQCGVTVLDSPSDMLCTALIYLNLNPESTARGDYTKAGKLLESVMPYITYIHSSRYGEDLAAGEICAAVAWSGDAQLASQKAKSAGLDPITYVIPKEGALTGYDMLAIPKDAPHPENAHLFLNYLMEPEIIAEITNYIRYANANAEATPLVDAEIRDNPGIYYPADTLERMHIVIPPPKVERILTRVWNNVRVNAGED